MPGGRIPHAGGPSYKAHAKKSLFETEFETSKKRTIAFGDWKTGTKTETDPAAPLAPAPIPPASAPPSPPPATASATTNTAPALTAEDLRAYATASAGSFSRAYREQCRRDLTVLAAGEDSDLAPVAAELLATHFRASVREPVARLETAGSEDRPAASPPAAPSTPRSASSPLLPAARPQEARGAIPDGGTGNPSCLAWARLMATAATDATSRQPNPPSRLGGCARRAVPLSRPNPSNPPPRPRPEVADPPNLDLGELARRLGLLASQLQSIDDLVDALADRWRDRKPRTLNFWRSALGELRASLFTVEEIGGLIADAENPRVKKKACKFSADLKRELILARQRRRASDPGKVTCHA